MPEKAPHHSDDQTTVSALKQMVENFVAERNWQQFHSPKNLAMSLAIEAAELMEHFQWLTVEQSWQVVRDLQKVEAIAEELADVLCYILAFANRVGIDLTEAVTRKLDKNAEKYPAELYRDRFGPDDPNFPRHGKQ